MWRSNPTWGSPRIVGELRTLGIHVAKSTVEKYRPRTRNPSSPTWKAFLSNHVTDIVACDFFTVPTATFRVLFVFIVLAHERRRIVHLNITEHPTAQWTAQQIVEAFPWRQRHDICCGIGTPSMVGLCNGDRVYGYRRSDDCAAHRRGRIPTVSGSSAVSGVSVSTMSSCSTSGICAAYCNPMCTTITLAAPSIIGNGCANATTR